MRTTLARALTLPENERLDYVRRQCSDDSELCTELEGLLAIHDSAEGFLNTPLPELLGAQVPVPNQLPPGTLLKNRYRVQKLLAASGFATVYLAEDEDIARRPVVVKVLDQITSNELLRDTFQAEMQSLAQLQHPNIVTLSDRGELPSGTPFLVLAYVPGETLRQVLKSSGPLPLYRVQTIVRGIAQALAAAHALSVWHLDIKPENIILSDKDTSNERVTVIDFGIARMRELPGSGVRAGSPQYMAPEQGLTPSARSDIFALAVVTFELLTGRVPDRRKPIRNQLPPGMPQWAGVLEQALSTDPAHRPESAVAFSKALRDPEEAGRLGRWWVWAGAATIALAATGFGIYWWQNQEPSQQLAPVPLVTNPGFKQMPAFTPDGTELYYVGGLQDQRHIYRKPLHGAAPAIVANHAFKDVFVQVSPTGDRLAIIRETASGRVLVIRNLRLDQAETEVDRGREFESITWTADGRHLFLGEGLLDEGTFRLGILDISSRRWRQILGKVPGGAGDHYPVVSPDGKWLGFVREWTSRQTDLMKVEIDESGQVHGQPELVIANRNRIHSFQWTPDSRELIFVDGPVGEGSLWRVGARGGKARQMLPGAGEVQSVSVPLRAWRMAYAKQDSDINVWRYDFASKQARQWIMGAYVDNEAHLSPDGKLIAFFSSRTGSEQMYLADPDGTNVRQVTNFEKPDALHAVWTPDSRNLVLSVKSAALGLRIYRVDITSGGRQTELRRDGFATAISRDGRFYYFRSLASGQWEIWRAPFEGGSAEQVTSIGGYTAGESLDGRKLYFAKRHERDGLWEMELPKGPARRIVDRPYRRSLFAPAQGGLYYVALVDGGNGQQGLYFRDDANGTSKLVHLFDRQIFWGLDLAPDGGSLLYSQYDVGNAQIMLINDFR